jgi:hypothetical protein
MNKNWTFEKVVCVGELILFLVAFVFLCMWLLLLSIGSFFPNWIVCPLCMFLINAHHKIKRAEGPRGFRAVSMKELPASLMWNGLPSDLVTSKKIGQSGRLYRRAYDETNGKWELIDKILHVAFFIWSVSFFFVFCLCFFLFVFFFPNTWSLLIGLKWCHARSLDFWLRFNNAQFSWMGCWVLGCFFLTRCLEAWMGEICPIWWMHSFF